MRWYPNSGTLVCHSYHGGMHTMLYALASCGYLGTGDEGLRDGRSASEWLRDLLKNLEGELEQAVALARGECLADAESLEDLLVEVQEALLAM